MVMCKPSSSMEHQQHLSGAYIRTLVKHLTTSVKSKDHSVSNEDHHNNNNIIQQQSPQPPHRKQVRRRRHTIKPYQERLLNMAEARREIVTALKFHRASMKQKQTTNNHHHHRQPELSPSTTATTTEDNLKMGSYPYHWPVSTTTTTTASTDVTPTVWPSLPPPENQENLDFTQLPDQTLGLNLNFQDFENMGHTTMNLYHNPLSNYPTTSSSLSLSLSTSSSSSLTSSLSSTSTSCSSSSSPSITTASSSFSGGLHHAMDDEGMEEIRSLGEQHQMEWNDTMNLLTSARWFKFLKDIDDDHEIDPLDQVKDHDIPLCMDIGEIEAMDGQWLA